jgi:hypothetical protein
MTQGVVDHAELAPERRLFTQGDGRFNMTGYGKRINQIQNRIWSFQQALVYCISELLEMFVGHAQTFTSNSTFC